MKTLGRYEIQEEIGRGAMGVVYLGNDPTINRTVAMKCLHLHLLEGDESIGKRFQQEMRALGRLIHPNIVPIFDAGKDPSSGRAFIVMEYVEGISLEGLIKENRDLSIDQIVQIGIKICRGLHFAHSKNVIHRDIKPGNILLSDDLEDVKITDFGIARLDNTALTQTGNLTGTPRYMSPEQYRGETLDGRSDLFAVGAILYELLTEQGPFQGDSLPTLMHQVIHHSPDPPSIVSKNISGPISDVVMRALEKAVSGRFASGKEMAEALINATKETRAVQPLSDDSDQTKLVMTIDPKSIEALEVSKKKQLPLVRYAVFFMVLFVVGIGLFFMLRETPKSSDPKKMEPETRIQDLVEIEQEKQDTREKLAQEKALAEQERLQQEELAGIERERLEAEKEKRAQETARMEQERVKRLELTHIEQESAKAEREKLSQEIALMKQERLKREEMAGLERKNIQQKKDKTEKERQKREKRAQEKARVEQEDLKQLALARTKQEKIKSGEKRRKEERLKAEREKLAQEKAFAEQERLKQLELARVEQEKIKAEEKRREQEGLKAERKKRAQEKMLAEQEARKRKLKQEKIEFARRKTSPPLPGDSKKLGEILDHLSAAYGKKDLRALKEMSQIPKDRVLFLEQLFKDYETLSVVIKDLSIVGHSAHVLISFTKLTSRKQNPVLPSNHWEDAILTLHKKEGKWGKVIW